MSAWHDYTPRYTRFGARATERRRTVEAAPIHLRSALTAIVDYAQVMDEEGDKAQRAALLWPSERMGELAKVCYARARKADRLLGLPPQNVRPERL